MNKIIYNEVYVNDDQYYTNFSMKLRYCILY